MSVFTSRIIKGGALLEDSRRFLEAWDPDLNVDDNVRRILRSNALGKASGSRSRAVAPVLRRRFVDPGPEVLLAVRSLLKDFQAFREACYYEACRTDDLLAAFAAEVLFAWASEGRSEVGLTNVQLWLKREPRTPAWNDETMTRVAHGLLSALRDFGLLEGQARKRLAPPRLSLLGFIYVALRERRLLSSDRALYTSPAWRRYLLSEERVRQLFLEADRARLLTFGEAGSVLKIDWRVDTLEEATRVLAA